MTCDLLYADLSHIIAGMWDEKYGLSLVCCGVGTCGGQHLIIAYVGLGTGHGHRDRDSVVRGAAGE